ncbi:uncharacterized protein LOC127247540 [Andrographis paniculata]|uniref:uncharacterized protein LOC127247540 n=1 Tax=Andrographis paniculata TaxID=175694 RepID=UPI0021E9A713|nr:uncharacterized protein LOC127247540 [Andrographis paniculata]XP_051125381.1 uncharacterized protein LOC127247540 [Andrographis paniculata]XP_051125382.1 uncharacterized protein LOC127247540 [Andrographis paniculata]
MVSMSSWMLSAKVVLISAGVASVAMGLKVSVPVAVDGIPALWSVVLSWMKPPYLYIIINGIIITIAASSRFHRSQSEAPAGRSERLVSVKTPPSSSFASFSSQQYINSSSVEESTVVDEVVVSEIEEIVDELKSIAPSSVKADSEANEEIVIEAESDDVVVDSLTEEKISGNFQFESLLRAREKPLVSSRFAHRKPIRNNPEVSSARALRVARPKKQETLESTWKMITEGRHVPLTRHIKKPDAWDQEPLKERSRYINPTSRIIKETSLGQDELNRRVEAFIKKFNDEMRMQRQESLNQFMEMINRGA